MDQAITHGINNWAGKSGFLDFTMIAIAQYGVPLIVVLVVVQWWSRKNRVHVRHTCVAAGVSFFAGLGLNQIILLFVHRLRPYAVGVSHLIIAPSGDWSFPSDHATATFAIAAAFLLNGMEQRGLPLLTAAVLVCVSRVFVGTHYFTDVLGGALTGLFAAAVVHGIYWENTRLDRLITRIL